MHLRKEDEYRWSVLPYKEYLFERDLSKMSTGVYTQIIRGISIFFEALIKDFSPAAIQNFTESPQVTTVYYRSPNGDSSINDRDGIRAEVSKAKFMSYITRLQSKVVSLEAKVYEWRNSAQREIGERKKIEAELVKAKTTFIASRKESIRLRRDSEQATAQSCHLKYEAAK
ncbi:hypothetical protein ACLMJK_003824 [Lecanora helva]